MQYEKRFPDWLTCTLGVHRGKAHSLLLRMLQRSLWEQGRGLKAMPHTSDRSSRQVCLAALLLSETTFMLHKDGLACDWT